MRQDKIWTFKDFSIMCSYNAKNSNLQNSDLNKVIPIPGDTTTYLQKKKKKRFTKCITYLFTKQNIL